VKTRVKVRVTGRVQGVWFRSSTKQKADELGLKGWVRNMDDGSVEAVFQGEEDKINDMIKWCHVGPSLAKVKKVYVEKDDEAMEDYSDFTIRYD
jgi:acylphosphatase